MVERNIKIITEGNDYKNIMDLFSNSFYEKVLDNALHKSLITSYDYVKYIDMLNSSDNEMNELVKNIIKKNYVDL